MRILLFFAAAVTVLAACGTTTYGSLLPGLFNTGVDDAGTPLNRGEADPHWTISVSSDPRFVAPAAAVTTTLNTIGGWINAGDTAKWVSIVNNGNTFIAPGTYVFETTFDLTGLDPSNAQIYGSFLVDNTVTDVLLNGNSIGLSGGEWTSSTAFSISDGFVPDRNTLSFVTQNRPPGSPNTPGGIAVRFDLPFDRVSLSADGEPYSETFDEALGISGRARGTLLPQGWISTRNNLIENTTTRPFPVGRSFRGEPVFNAGAENNADRALAIGVSGDSEHRQLQLHAQMSEGNASALQLEFDIEAWDARLDDVELVGEAAFNVSVDVDSGDGFTKVLDFGSITTGKKLQLPARDHLDDNAVGNRHSFDSGIQPLNIPAGSTLRILWTVPPEASTTGWVYGLDNVQLTAFSALHAGDADQDYDFDQLDLIQVQQAAKYLTGELATWGDGDWDGAPAGAPGNPPAGNGRFDQLDVIAALGAGTYLNGPYAALQPNGQLADGQTSLIYDTGTGKLAVDAPTGVELTSINIDSAAGIFTGQPAANLGGSFDNDADSNIFKATFGGSFGSVSFGNVAQSGLSEDFVLGDLSVVGSLSGGGDLGNVDLVYVPEPASVLLLSVGVAIAVLRIGRKRQ